MSWRSLQFKLLAVLLIIGIIPPLLLVLIKGDLPIASDQLDFHQMAIGFLEGNGLRSSAMLHGIAPFPNLRHPLYPFFIACLYSFTNNSIIVVKIIQVLMQGLTCVIIFLISEKVFRNKLAAFAAGVLWALYPLAVNFSTLLLCEGLLTFLLALSILFILKYQQDPSRKNMFLSGICLGLTALTKSIIFVFIPILFLWIVLSSEDRLTPKLKRFSVVMLFMALTISPWLVRNQIALKSPLPISTGGGLAFYWYNNEKSQQMVNTPLRFVSALTEEQIRELSSLSERQTDKYLYKLGWQFIRAHPQVFLKRVLIEFYYFWHLLPALPARYAQHYLQEKQLGMQNTFLDSFLGRFRGSWLLYFCKLLYHLPYNILFLGMVMGLRSFRKNNEWQKTALLLFLLIAAVNLVYIFYHGTDRYRLPIDPYVFILGVQGVILFYNNFKKRRGRWKKKFPLSFLFLTKRKGSPA